LRQKTRSHGGYLDRPAFSGLLNSPNQPESGVLLVDWDGPGASVTLGWISSPADSPHQRASDPITATSVLCSLSGTLRRPTHPEHPDRRARVARRRDCACRADRRQCARCSRRGLITQRDEDRPAQGADRRLRTLETPADGRARRGTDCLVLHARGHWPGRSSSRHFRMFEHGALFHPPISRV
jgi:hypothetical protein